VAGKAETNIDPWGRSLMETLRRWWWIPATLALVGALIGGVAGLRAPKTAEVLLRVQSTAENGDGLTQAAQSALTELATHEVYGPAAKARGVTEEDLRTRTEVTTVPSSLILSVKVTAPDAEAAVADANAFAESGVKASNKRLTDELKGLAASTDALINSSPLRDTQAETQRRLRLGGQTADNQGQLLLSSRQLTVLQRAETATVKSTSPALLAAMGLLGGGLLGAALTLLFGGRRGRMASLPEMRRLYPDLEFIPARDVPAVMSMEAGTADNVVLSGVHAPAAAVRSLVEPVTAGVHAAGREVLVTEDVARLGADPATTGPIHRDVTVLQTPLSGAIVKRAARDPHSVLLVLVRPHKTRFEWLDEHAAQFGERTYVVVDG